LVDAKSCQYVSKSLSDALVKTWPFVPPTLTPAPFSPLRLCFSASGKSFQVKDLPLIPSTPFLPSLPLIPSLPLVPFLPSAPLSEANHSRTVPTLELYSFANS
jgi:hypothetical protein